MSQHWSLKTTNFNQLGISKNTYELLLIWFSITQWYDFKFKTICLANI